MCEYGRRTQPSSFVSLCMGRAWPSPDVVDGRNDHHHQQQQHYHGGHFVVFLTRSPLCTSAQLNSAFPFWLISLFTVRGHFQLDFVCNFATTKHEELGVRSVLVVALFWFVKRQIPAQLYGIAVVVGACCCTLSAWNFQVVAYLFPLSAAMNG